ANRRKTGVRKHRLSKLSRNCRDKRYWAFRSRSHPSNESPYYRGSRRRQYAGKLALLDSEPRHHQARFVDAGNEIKRYRAGRTRALSGNTALRKRTGISHVKKKNKKTKQKKNNTT